MAETTVNCFNEEGPYDSVTRRRLLLADDHDDFLREVTVLLQGEFEVIGVARDGVALLNVAADLNPGCDCNRF